MKRAWISVLGLAALYVLFQVLVIVAVYPWLLGAVGS